MKVGRGPPQSRKQPPANPKSPGRAGAGRSSPALAPPAEAAAGEGARTPSDLSRSPELGVGAGEGCAGRPLASREPLRTCGCRGRRRGHPEGRAAAASRARRGRSHFYAAAACDRLFRFCRLRQFAPTFRLKLPFSASSFARWDRPSPAFFFFFFLLLGNHQNSNRCAPPKPRTGRASSDQAPPGCAEQQRRWAPAARRSSGLERRSWRAAASASRPGAERERD